MIGQVIKLYVRSGLVGRQTTQLSVCNLQTRRKSSDFNQLRVGTYPFFKYVSLNAAKV